MTKQQGKSKIEAWPPRWLSNVPAADLKRSRGINVVDFSQTLCKITKDSIAGDAGTPMIFRPWQTELTRHLMAVKSDGTFRHKVALIGLPRKNGKSAWLSALALEHLVLGPQGGEVYSCAADRDQARIVFGTAKRMIEMQPELSEFLNVYRDAIYNPKTGATYRALSAEAFTKEGLSPTFVAFDELHAQPNRELFDVMSLAMGARREPQLIAITTAGVKTDTSGKDSLCYSLYNYGKKVALGEIDDPSFFFAWWEASENADHRALETWRESNPGFDDIVAADDFESVINRTPESEFRTKRCNQWVSTSDTWLPVGSWELCADAREIDKDVSVVLAFDGSFNGDCTAIVGVTVEDKPHVFVVQSWEKPDGEAADWQVPILEVEDTIRNACMEFQVLEIACDPYRWARTFQVLEDENLPVVLFPQSSARMTPATTRFFEAVMNKSLTHDEDARLARHVSNATLRTDSRGSRLQKENKNSARRIDLAVAAVMGLERASWWNTQGSGLPMIFDLDNLDGMGDFDA